jgi:phage shock protein A
MQNRAAQLQARSPELEQQAREALHAGREALARLSLQQQHLAEAEAQQLHEQALAMRAEGQRLALVEQRLLRQMEALEVRQTMVAARTAAAEAQAQLGETLYGVADELTALGAELEQKELQADYLTARVSALDELVQSTTAEATATSAAVEARLSALKREGA